MLLLVQIVIFVLQVQAFVAGVGHAWGFGTFASVIIGFLFCLIPGIGGALIGAMTFYGAYAAWDWAWWQAFILAAPGFAISVFALAGSAIIGFFTTRAQHRV